MTHISKYFESIVVRLPLNIRRKIYHEIIYQIFNDYYDNDVVINLWLHLFHFIFFTNSY